MGQVRAIVTYRLTGDIETAKDVMRRAAAYTGERFGDRFIFDPFVNEATGKVIWVNTAADEDALVEPITDPRLERLGEPGTMMTSMLV